MELGPKWLQLLHEVVPTATTFALLVNPTSPDLAEAQSRDLQNGGPYARAAITGVLADEALRLFAK
jgi:hypothetical protein